MARVTEKTAVKLQNYFEDTEQCLQRENYNVLVAYAGQFSKDIVNSIPESVEQKLREKNQKKSIIKRVFSILIEGLQNIRKHSDFVDDDESLGYVFIANNQEEVCMQFANLVNDESLNIIDGKLTELKSMNDDEIKKHYIEILNNGFMSELGGAGLGLITMVLKSSNYVKYSFEELEDGVHLFNVKIKVHFEA